MKLRADAKERTAWERTAALRKQIYNAFRGEDDPPAHQLPEQCFNPMAK